MSQRTKRIIVAVIALLVAFSLIVPALAHSQLVDSDPADGATLDMADAVTLTFNEDITAEFVVIEVTGPGGDDVVDGAPAVDGPEVTQPIAPTSNGEYALTYRVVSQDGHPISGMIGFTLTDVPAPEPTAESPPESPTAAPSESATAAPTTQPETSDDASGFTWSLGVGLTLGVLALAALGAGIGYWARRSRD